MILNALVNYYETLSNECKLPKYGWTMKGISYAIDIDDNGEITQITSIKTLQPNLKSGNYVPQEIEVPKGVKRTSGIKSNFLWDSSKYLFGIAKKPKETNEKPETTSKQSIEIVSDSFETEVCGKNFDCCKKLHTEYLKNSENPAAKALVKFFSNWDVDNADAKLRSLCSEDDFMNIIEKANLTFTYDGQYICEQQEIRDILDSEFNSAEKSETEATDSGNESHRKSICLVTGEKTVPQKVHPAIKMRGAQSSGAALVSFNAPAYCSYGKVQNSNAPVGSYAAYCYTAALNHLLSDYGRQAKIGDTTVIWWAEGGQKEYQDIFNFSFFGKCPEKYSAQDLSSAVKDLCIGNSVTLDERRIDPNMKFYVLGLTPNNARISIRFFMENTFCSFLKNAQQHQERLEICHSKTDGFNSIPLWMLLKATVNTSERDPAASPNMAGDTLRSILCGTLYPATLLNGVMMRIRAEKDITWERAAAIKAYYLKNTNNDVPTEVLQVSLNKDSTNVPYVLGRLFSTLEEIQQKANPGINATIKDKYFNAASSTPAVVFPQLINLTQKHLRKLDTGPRIYLDKKLSQIMDLLNEEFPSRLSLAQQGSFALGYYHQTQERYMPNNKENNQNG